MLNPQRQQIVRLYKLKLKPVSLYFVQGWIIGPRLRYSFSGRGLSSRNLF